MVPDPQLVGSSRGNLAIPASIPLRVNPHYSKGIIIPGISLGGFLPEGIIN